MMFSQQETRILSGASSPASQTARCKVTDNRWRICRAEKGGSQKATSSQDADIGDRMPYKYLSSDGRKKATLEDALVQSRDASGGAQIERNTGMGGSQPWTVGWQMSERHLMWNDDLAARLLKRVTAEELNCSDEELEQRYLDLIAVMPGVVKKMQTMKPKLLAALMEDPAGIAEKLLLLRNVFPSANIEQMVLRDFSLLLEKSIAEVEEAAQKLQEILPADVDLDRICEEHPSMLEVDSFKMALDEVKRLMPKLDISTALRTQPEIIFSTQRTKGMIPYEPVPGNSH